MVIHTACVLFYVFYMVFPPKFVFYINALLSLRGRKWANIAFKGEKMGKQGEKMGDISTTRQGEKMGTISHIKGEK